MRSDKTESSFLVLLDAPTDSILNICSLVNEETRQI